MQFPARDKKLYAGRGDLVGWLRISAVRELNLRRNRSARELSLETHAVLDASSEQEPEVALLLKMHKQELTEAFRQALASMSSRERNVLRYHFVEKVSIDQIGALYSVHRSTAARWISRAREALCMRTRAFFRERISMSDEGFQRVVALIESQIQVELARAASLTR
jgi:RNA polymerase sigma-70 factor (ECF subfamily)